VWTSTRHSDNIENLGRLLHWWPQCALSRHAWQVAHCLSGWGCATHAAWHITGRLTCPSDSLAQQTHSPSWLTCSTDYLAQNTHLPIRLTCPSDSLVQQTHLPGRLTCPADSLAQQTHLPSRLTCPADSLAQQAHLPDAMADDTPNCCTKSVYYRELCREEFLDSD
jgi:hypothetical protein